MDILNKLFSKQIKNEEIKYLKKKEYETYYSTRNKYPYLVVERLNMRTGHPAEGQDKIKREDVNDPFKPESKFPSEISFTTEDYTIMMSHGISPGHNAPAGHHQTNKEIWSETFSYANISPQEMIFNSGIWVLIENWCKYISKLQKNKNFTNLRVFTGSIPDPKGDTKMSLGDKSVSVNIPTHMFKLVCARSKDIGNEKKIFMTCFMCPNKPIDPDNKENQNIINWTIPFDILCNMTNIEFETLLEKYYGYSKNEFELVNINELTPIKFDLSPIFEKQMIKSQWYGLLIYVKDIEQLEENWKICQEVLKDENVEYHKEFYNLVKKRLQHDKDNTPLTEQEEEELSESSRKISMMDNEREIPFITRHSSNNNKQKPFNFFGLFKKGGKTRFNNINNKYNHSKSNYNKSNITLFNNKYRKTKTLKKN